LTINPHRDVSAAFAEGVAAASYDANPYLRTSDAWEAFNIGAFLSANSEEGDAVRLLSAGRAGLRTSIGTYRLKYDVTTQPGFLILTVRGAGVP